MNMYIRKGPAVWKDQHKIFLAIGDVSC